MKSYPDEQTWTVGLQCLSAECLGGTGKADRKATFKAELSPMPFG